MPTNIHTPLTKGSLLFSQRLLDALDSRVAELPEREQENLAMFLKGSVDSSYARGALTAIWENPVLSLLDKTAGNRKADVAKMMPSLLVWALNRPWAGEIDVKRLLSKWRNAAITNAPNTQEHQMVNAALFLRGFAPLVALIPEERREHFVSQVYTTLEWLTEGRAYPKANHACTGEIAIAMGHLAAICGNSISTNGLPLPEQWVRHLHATLEARPASTAKVELSIEVVLSTLPNELKTRALLESPSAVWARPDVSALLLPTLPTDERARFEHLPWVEVGDHWDKVKENQAVLRVYCPQIAAIVELVTLEDDWIVKRFMAEVIERFSPDKPQLLSIALPPEFENS